MNEQVCTPYKQSGISFCTHVEINVSVSNPQKIQKWRMLPVDLCEKYGDLTPTQKIKRNVVNAKYSDLCDEMYGE